MKLALKINGQWAILPDNASISIVSTSPLFDNDNGDISYPFELDIHENAHIFHSLADTHGYERLADYNGLSVEVWYDGLQLFTGETEVDDSVEFDGDTISINVVSAGKSFSDAIDGMNCRDVPLNDNNILLGVVPCVNPNTTDPLSLKVEGSVIFGPFPTKSEAQATANQFNSIRREGKQILVASTTTGNVVDVGVVSGGYMENVTFDAPRFLIPRTLSGALINKPQLPYPTATHCYAKLCQPNGEKAADGADGSGYYVTDIQDVNAAPSFYLLYFLECLFMHIGYSFDMSELKAIEDMCRIIMLNTFPRYRMGDIVAHDGLDTDENFIFQECGFKFKYLTVKRKRKISCSYGTASSKEDENKWSDELKYAVNGLREAYATSDNFPNVEVTKVVESLQNAFGVIFDCDQYTHTVTLRLKRNIMKSSETQYVRCTVLQEHITRQRTGGVKLTYGVDDDVLYDYDTTEAAVSKLGYEAYSGYNSIVASDRSATDTATKYDLYTGNAFRIKVNEDTGLEPQLFAVATYNDVVYGRDNTGAIEPEEITIPFTPVTTNDIWGWRQAVAGNPDAHPTGSSDSEMAVFVSEESFGNRKSVKSLADKNGKTHNVTMPYSEAVVSNFAKNYATPDGKGAFRVSWDGMFSIYGPAARDLSDEGGQYPLERYDAGLQLGIMRGVGSITGGVSVIETNYDGEGNNSWGYFPPRGGGISTDSVDLWGSPHDYGTGAPTSIANRISLMLDARKVQSYTDAGDPVFYPIEGVPSGIPSAEMERRGLVPQFLEDYLYFIAHKTPVTLEIEISLSDFMALSYFKRANIGNHTGFIYSKEYTLTNDGLQKAIITLYELNK